MTLVPGKLVDRTNRARTKPHREHGGVEGVRICKLAMVALCPDIRSLLRQVNDLVFNDTQGDIIDDPESFLSS